MSYKLSDKEYRDILTYYKVAIPKSRQTIQEKAEDIMSTKLCKCIKKLDPINESRAIGICTKTIFTRKGYKRGKFTCKQKPKAYFSKGKQSKKNLLTRKK